MIKFSLIKPINQTPGKNSGETKIVKSLAIAILLFALSYILKVNFVIPLLLVLFSIFLSTCQQHKEIKDYSLLADSLLFTLIFTISYFISFQGLPVFYIPFSVLPMLSVLLFNELIISLLLVIVSSVTLAVIAGNNLETAVLFLISGILAAIFIIGTRKRSVIIRTGFFIGLIQTVTLLFIREFRMAYANDYLAFFINGIACAIIVIGILPVFEYLFKTVTNISLLELADFNQPLLQQLILEAPGTYHHSLIVGNLSDIACQAIGANALLARIGAYYHDIGKLSKPEYFSENQSIDSKAKHDSLSPAMSKLVIMNHVKEGVELANRFKLNPRLIDFIYQHHGNSLVYYFYRRALENSDQSHEVEEDGFRYPGPKPRTKETAIVLLADSVEAGTRCLRQPTPAAIEEAVHKIINNKFIDGQLDECDLTLKDLEKIAAEFIRVLSGIYHSRITYPEA